MAVLNGSSAIVEYSDDSVPTNWLKIPDVLSIDSSFNMEEIDVTHNSSAFFKAFLPGDMDGTLTITVRYDPALVVGGGDGDHDSLVELFEARTANRFWRVSPDGATAPDWSGQGFITSVSNPIAHSQGIDISFTVRLSKVNAASGQIVLTTA